LFFDVNMQGNQIDAANDVAIGFERRVAMLSCLLFGIALLAEEAETVREEVADQNYKRDTCRIAVFLGKATWSTKKQDNYACTTQSKLRIHLDFTVFVGSTTSTSPGTLGYWGLRIMTGAGKRVPPGSSYWLEALRRHNYTFK
jgi:hypothetical protein